MLLAKMKYKDFEFPINPGEIEIKYSRKISEKSLIDSDTSVYNFCKNPSVISGSGKFFGKSANEYLNHLCYLNKNSESGWLFLPNGECFDAFFKDLYIKQNSKEESVFYSFVFIENCHHKSVNEKLDFTTVKKNENLFDVANRCGVLIEKIMENNDYKTPFDVKKGDEVKLC